MPVAGLAALEAKGVRALGLIPTFVSRIIAGLRMWAVTNPGLA